eukprot:CAMPEP_0196768580 /NCGR_PEP_ID=MMETSP1095-20130614/42958_1 /TAXON_ID=96789 ORGANISM="Chromulina nebulosa, Strain UTEXLB2642" /NCGR_SAMPLE_ID=MMETSP1095 /ASSEMBLY_ACC=CAM_ASM_000446 /LENGTH=225 /DNA_ID=CAMNT_0042138433 /DNA_START=412 /DNA_END=1086 /DNA_ORIENTATION=+
MAPKATSVAGDKDLQSFCGYNKNTTKDINSVGSTCLVLIKGSRYTKSHSDLESQLVKENPKLKVALVDGSKRRLSFENPNLLPHDSFALKAYAIRNGTHYQTMVNPLTYDYLSNFVTNAVGSPLYDYQGDGHVPISLLKLSSPVFKRKSNDEEDIEDEEASTKKPKGSKKKPNKKEKESTKSDSKKGSSNDEDIHQKEKERIKRENMDRQSKQRLYDDEESVEYE